MNATDEEPPARVDPDMCAAVGQCMLEAPGAFRFDDDGVSSFDPHGPWTPRELERAAEFCPMTAISLRPSLTD